MFTFIDVYFCFYTDALNSSVYRLLSQLKTSVFQWGGLEENSTRHRKRKGGGASTWDVLLKYNITCAIFIVGEATTFYLTNNDSLHVAVQLEGGEEGGEETFVFIERSLWHQQSATRCSCSSFILVPPLYYFCWRRLDSLGAEFPWPVTRLINKVIRRSVIMCRMSPIYNKIQNMVSHSPPVLIFMNRRSRSWLTHCNIYPCMERPVAPSMIYFHEINCNSSQLCCIKWHIFYLLARS